MPDGATGSLFARELVVDLFAGGGGASLGLSRAYRYPDVAVNHNAVAIAVHQANHPETSHYVADVFEVDPVTATGGQPVAVLWASPDCRHHSKAKGGKPRSKKIRGLAWVVTKWAAAVRPRIICLENVEEFADWGPLLPNGQPCPARKGMTFRRWKRQLENLGYVVEHRELVAADYGAPTIRKRLYLIARCDGRPIVWPQPTHAKVGSEAERAGRLKPWRAAAECIDFDLPAKSIFGRKKPLAVNTQRRVAKGMWRFVLNCSDPFIVGGGGRMGQSPGRGIAQPFQTVTAKADAAIAAPLVTPFLTEHANASTQRVFDAQEPLRTQVAQIKGGHFALVAPHLATIGYGERAGQAPRAQDIQRPLGTVVGTNKHALAAASLVKFRRHSNGADLTTPLGAVTGGGEHHGLIAAHVTKFRAHSTGHALGDPLHTVCAGGDMQRPAGAAHAMGLVAAHLTHLTHHGERSGNAADEPMRTVTGAHRGEQAVVAAYFEQANGGFYEGDGLGADLPLSTVTASGTQQRLVQAYLVKYYGEGGQWQGCAEPMHTIPTKDRMGVVQVVQVDASGMAPEMLERAREVAAFLRRHLPEHFAEPADLVLVGGYVMVDITLRMLTPRELARAQGFPDDYALERGWFVDAKAPGGEWRAITKTDQVRLIGNSVCPDMAEALVRANAADLIDLYSRVAA